MALPKGTQLGPYEILAPIGAGGMGEVYKGRDTRLDRIIAIKVSKAEFSERFQQEARAVAALNHPHICALYDVGQDYLVMEYIEGHALEGPLPLDQALKYAAQICEALDAAHTKGITHRDLKPANILVTKAGVKLLDFGLASIARTQVSDETVVTALTSPGTVLGTFQYAAPEQLEAKQTDARTDIFAFGAVLYEMLTGRRAFDGKTQASVIAAILERPAPSITDIAPPALDRVLKTCLAKDPDDRWQTARDLRRQLQWIDTGAVAPSTPSGINATTPAGTASRGTRKYSYALIGILLAALAIVLWAPWRTPPEPESFAFEIHPQEGITFSNLGIVSPDGRWIALLVRGKGLVSLGLRRMDSRDIRIIPESEGADVPAWSPDSRWVVFDNKGKLRKVEVAGGPAQVITDQDPARIPFTSWGDAGVILLTGSGGRLMRVSASGGTAVPITTLNEERGETRHSIPQFLPGGKRFLFFAENRQQESNAMFAGSIDGPPESNRQLVMTTPRAAFYTRAAGGEYLLFERDRGALMAQTFDSGSLKLTGEAFPVVAQVGFNNQLPFASASSTGVLAYLQQNTPRLRQLSWLDRTGKHLSDAGPPANYLDGVTLSPDQRRVAFHTTDANNTDISIMNLSPDAVPQRFTFDAAPDTYPIWTNDSARVIFGRGGKMYQKPAAGTAVEQLFLDARGNPMDFSPDGRHFLYFSLDNALSQPNLWIATGGKAAPFSKLDDRERHGQFSPHGKWIAYDAGDAGNEQVYVQPFPATGRKFQVTKTGGLAPRWRSDGKELYYVSQARKLMAVPVKFGVGFEAGPATPLFDVELTTTSPNFWPYFPSPDGQRFLVLHSLEQEAGPRPIVVLTNWLAAASRGRN